MLMKLDPEGCLGLECDGRLAATTTVICYGDKLAWIGMVLTHPHYRRRGFARRLMERGVQLAEARRIATVKLDATEQGRTLYESLGFQAEQEIQRWSGTPELGRRSGVTRLASLDELAELDRAAFGADRSQLLKLLSNSVEPVGSRDAFMLWRPGTRANYAGPCVARSRAAARDLFHATLKTHNQLWFWDLLPANLEAVALAAELGFRVERRLIRMARGEKMRNDDSLVYGIAGLELG